MIKGNSSWLLLLCFAFVMTGNAVDKDKKKPSETPKKGERRSKKEKEKKAKGKEEKGEEKEFEITESTKEEPDVDQPAKEEKPAEEEKVSEEEAEKKEPEAQEEPQEEEPKEEETKKEKKTAVLIPTEEKPWRTAQEAQAVEKEAEPEEAEEGGEEPEIQESMQGEQAEGEEPEEVVAVEEQEVVAPEAEPEEEAQPQPALGPDEIMGIDTVDLEDPQGNWLYKRVWWERAEAKYEKIRAAVTSVLEVRTRFFAKRSELDKNVLDPFYVKTGFSQGELKEKLAERIAQLEQEIQTKSSAELLERLEDAKQTLQDLRKDVDIVLNYDHEIEQAILMLVEQSNKMRNYEQQAWQDFKNIARVLDDKKARELFYKVDGAWRNIQDLKQYVESNFSSGFDQLVERLIKQVEKVDAAMQQLKEKGIELKKVEQEEIEIEEVPQPGIFSRFIIIPIKTVLRAIWDIITWPIRKLTGWGSPKTEEVEKMQVEEVEVPVKKPEQLSMPSAQPKGPMDFEISAKAQAGAQMPMMQPEQGMPASLKASDTSSMMPTPPDVPMPNPEGTPLAPEDVAPQKVKETEAPPSEMMEEVEESEEMLPAGPTDEVAEQTIAVPEGEPMADETADLEQEAE